MSPHRSVISLVAIALGLAVVTAGCGRSGSEHSGLARTPGEAASQLDQAFADADAEAREAAAAASEALRRQQYETALRNLVAIETRPNVSLDQGMAVYSSMRTLEADLVAAMQAGDENAKRTYLMLKAMKRN
ncbi:MAG: hypothetical protein H7A45_21140 [Verrucomicrobiales bacterium]|nr:hypothetical protein [Verrucomicrobiales bacterium]MCP5525836.1 hypothetical protein [Verrucomicrobiales bacterium]